ncbi:MAG TPA: MMPL family transporter, partial [Candidatus Dormibacteraeota bacterium]|nr:MMPL family transporter [Candidatus Dormibacteraeota bacterium]
MKLLARLTTGKPWSVVAAALLFTAIAGAFGGPVAGILQGGGFFDPHSAGKAASDKVQGATGALASPVIILVRLTAPIASPEAHEQVLAAESSLSADPNIQSIGGYYDTGSPTFLSTDGTQTFLAVNLKPATPDAGIEAEHIAALLKSQPNTKVGGAAMAQQQVQEQVKKDLGMAESLAFPLLFLLSLWVFRGLIAATLPLMGGGITILGAFLGLRLVTLHTPLSIFALNLTTGMGLGLAIDYSLFILSRFREEMKAGLTVDKAVSRSLATAGRTVLFSSLTVAVALSSLLVFPEPFLYSMAVGGIITSLMAAASALVLLPAVLRLLGRRVNSLAPTRWHREMEEAEGFWYRLARIVLRRPVFSALAAGGVLILLGLPFLSMKFTSVDTSVLPASYSSRQVNDVLTQDFPATATPAMYAVFTSPSGDPGAVQAFAQRLAGLPEVKAVSLQPLDVQTWRIGITVR